MLEELKQLLRQFSMKGWLLYYSEKRKNVKNRGQLQSPSPASKVEDGEQGSGEPRISKKL